MRELVPDRWRLTILLSSIACLNYADRTAISAVFPLVQKDLGMSNVALGAVGSLFLWAYAFGSPFAGYLADRASRRRIILASLAAWSVVSFATGLVHSSHQLLLTRVFLGLAESAYLPAAIALLADFHSPSTRATAMGIHLASLNLGPVAGATLAGSLGERFGWRPAFFVLGICGLVLAAVTGHLLKDPPIETSGLLRGSQAEVGSSWRTTAAALIRTPTYLVVLSEATLLAIGVWMFLSWLPLYFNERFHMSLGAAAFSATSLLQLAPTGGFLLGGVYSDRIAAPYLPRRMLFHALCLFVAAPFLWVFIGSVSLTVIYCGIFVFSLMRGLGGSNEHPVICDVLAPQHRATAIGIMNATTSFAGGVGSLLTGYLKNYYGLGAIFAGVSTIALLAALLLLIAYFTCAPRDVRRRLEEEREAGTRESVFMSRPARS